MLSNTAECYGLDIRNCLKDRADREIARDVREGLLAEQKRLPSKYFYDADGSILFEEICRLPEYYVTRTEMALLNEVAGDITADFNNGDLVELGSGANWKIRMLLDAMDRDRRAGTRYVPVDVSESALVEAARDLLDIYPELDVMGVVADFTVDLHRIPRDRSKLVLFFGSTIGNLDHDESRTFLDEVSDSLTPGDRFLLGMDMLKPVEIIEAAYSDAAGVTAAFNKNVLRVVNRELAATFDLDHFDHLAFFNEAEERVEMHLRANRSVSVDIYDLEMQVDFAEGETIRTEICRKFSPESAERMIAEAGMTITRRHTDPKGWFSLAEATLQ